MYEDLTNQIEQLVLPHLNALGMELIDLKISQRGRANFFVQILIDKYTGGITMGECSRLNRSIAVHLDEMKSLPGNFLLEVSSPGVDRPLKTREDFLRVMNRDVRFFLFDPVGQKMEHAGIIKKVDEECVMISGILADIRIPYGKIKKAVQIIGALD